MKMRLLAAAAAILGILCTGCGTETADYRQITMEEAAVWLEEEQDLVLLDVRTPEEYAEGHLPGAINLPNETISDEPPSVLPDFDQQILVYCRSGNRSKQAVQKLVQLGYTDVVEIGGILDWDGEVVSGEGDNITEE